MPISLYDVAVIFISVVSALFAMARGFIREVLTAAVWIVSGALAFLFHGSILPLLSGYMKSPLATTVLSVGILFLVLVIVLSLLSSGLTNMIISTKFGSIDRGLGFILGIARALVFLVIPHLLIVSFFPGSPPNFVKESKTAPVLNWVSDAVIDAYYQIVPSDITDRIDDILNGGTAEKESDENV